MSTQITGQQVMDIGSGASEVLSALKRFTGQRSPVERCELCSGALEEVHQPLLERRTRQVACACDACAILFCDQQGGEYLRVPRRILELNDFAFSDLEWERMMLPINLAFFLRTQDSRMVAMYPSPAGAVESQIELNPLADNLAGSRTVAAMQPEVEALIANRVGTVNMYFIAPIDECYRLTGVIRTKWRGLSGGPDVWKAITEFFHDLKRKAGKPAQVNHA